MRKALLIAEKPSLLEEIRKVYNANRSNIPYEITFVAQRGHLLELYTPDEMDESLKAWSWDTLPIHPEEHGGWKYKVKKEKKTGNFLTSKERFDTIKKELKSGTYDLVINAGDPDQEGELLICETLEYLHNRLPVSRFWTNDLTEKAIFTALVNLRDDEHDLMLTNLRAAAYGRQHSDYRFGMNLSRAATLKMGVTVSVGRVETPILAIVCKREEEIKNFVPSTNYGIQAEYSKGFPGALFEMARRSSDENADEEAKSGIVRYETKKEAEDVIKTLPNKATVTTFKAKTVKTEAPKLFKLASAQVAAGKLGHGDAETLAEIQYLYEHKLMSYPRTECEYLSSHEDFKGILQALSTIDELRPYTDRITDEDIARIKKNKRYINDKALEESGHSALRPTENAADLSQLTMRQKDIYLMVAKRFIAIFLPPILQDQTLLIAEADGKTFRSTGKTLVDPGFSTIFGTKFTDTQIPRCEEGEVLDIDRFSVTAKTTTCPKRFTSPDLIAVCENPLKYLDDPALKALGKRLKIGTPATRSSTITKLLDKPNGGLLGYLTKQKTGRTEYVVPTQLGKDIIANLGPCDICKVDLTGIWEEELDDVREGKKTLSELESGMIDHVTRLLKDIQERPMKVLGTQKNRPVYATITKCPVCGKDIRSGEKGCFCSAWKSAGCKVWLPRSKWGVQFTDEDFVALLGGNVVTKPSTNADGEPITLQLRYDLAKGGLYDANAKVDQVMTCPTCGGTILANDQRFYCTGNGTGKTCDVSGRRVICDAKLTIDDMQQLLNGQEIVRDLTAKGRTWAQKLRYNMDTHEIDFVKEERPGIGIKCPLCKKAELTATDKTYRCQCGFYMLKTLSGRAMTKDDIDALAKDGRIELSGFVSKTGNAFDAPIKLDKRGKTVSFDFAKKTTGRKKK